MVLYDTQVISYDCNGHSDVICEGGYISAITGLEFLQIQGRVRTKARYYIPSPHLISRGIAFDRNRDHPFPKMLTDSVLLHVGAKYGAYIEYSNIALTHVINERRADVFDLSAKFQEKEEFKVLKRRFGYLMKRQIRSIALSEEIIDTAFSLLYRFLTKHTPKSDFRNTLNDMLIFATSLDTGMGLVTEDSLLLRFISEECGGVVTNKSNLRYYSPPRAGVIQAPSKLESKGYINQGWSYKIRNKKGE